MRGSVRTEKLDNCENQNTALGQLYGMEDGAQMTF
jgi:hypothetical protein